MDLLSHLFHWRVVEIHTWNEYTPDISKGSHGFSGWALLTSNWSILPKIKNRPGDQKKKNFSHEWKLWQIEKPNPNIHHYNLRIYKENWIGSYQWQLHRALK